VNSSRLSSYTAGIEDRDPSALAERRRPVPEGLVLFIVLATTAALVAAIVWRARAAVPSAAYLRIVGVASPISRLHHPRRLSRKAPHVRSPAPDRAVKSASNV
jgi:hypothetical protein